MPKITIIEEDVSGEFASGSILLSCINAMKVKIGQVCGGDGACGTCRVEVVSGWDHLSSQTPDETYKELEEPYRLSCQAKVLADIVIKIAKID